MDKVFQEYRLYIQSTEHFSNKKIQQDRKYKFRPTANLEKESECQIQAIYFSEWSSRGTGSLLNELSMSNQILEAFSARTLHCSFIAKSWASFLSS